MTAPQSKALTWMIFCRDHGDTAQCKDALIVAISEIDRLNAEREVLKAGVLAAEELLFDDYLGPAAYAERRKALDDAHDILAAGKATVAQPVPTTTKTTAPEMWLPSASDQEAMSPEDDE